MWTPKNFRDRKVTPLIFLNIALWSALRKVSEFQWSNQDVQTQRGFQSHSLDQTTASLKLNFGWFQRTKKHYHCNAPFNIGRNLAKKKHIMYQLQAKNILQYIDLFPFNLFKKLNKFEIQYLSFLNYLSSTHLDISKNSGTPKSSILLGFSIINHSFWGTPIFGNTQIIPVPPGVLNHIFTTRWPRHLSAAQSPNLRAESLINYL